MRNVLQVILYVFARLALVRYKPLVVAITGSVGKTSTKEAVYAVLRAQYHSRVRKTELNWNTEIGTPLTILGLPSGGKNIFVWITIFFRALLKIVWDPQYPHVLVLEMGADKPGDIQYLAGLARPTIGVVTAVGDIPVHVEFFAGPKNLAREKARLIEALPMSSGYAVLNYDDETVLEMRERTRARNITFGFGENAAVRATAMEVREGESGPEGINFKLEHNGKIVPVRLYNIFGKSAVYAALAGACVGIALKMNLVEIAEALALIEPPPGRLRLIKGEKQTRILDDTYNASPLAVQMALETLASLEAKRRIAVLGDMLELGKYSEAAHRAVGEKILNCADIFIAVGERARFIADEARGRGMAPEKTFEFSATTDAAAKLEDILREGDVVLVKGSRAMHMENIVKEVMAHPEEAGKLLVAH